MRASVKILLPFLFLSSCVATAGSVSQQTSIGVGETGFMLLSKKVIEDMQIFFSKQIVFSAREDCAVRVMLDSQKLDNESTERIDFNLLQQAFVERLEDKKAKEKLSLVARKLSFIDRDRNFLAGREGLPFCKKSNRVGADYLLAGRIISDDKINADDIRQRQTLISFWLLDLETGAKAWASQPYIFKSYGQNDVIYR